MSYTQPTQDERYHIQYLSRHCTIAEIAKQLNRHKSTISREIRRHRTQGQQYSAEKAQRQSRLTKQRRRKPYKLDSPPENTWLRNAKCFILESVPTTGTLVLHLKSESKGLSFVIYTGTGIYRLG